MGDYCTAIDQLDFRYTCNQYSTPLPADPSNAGSNSQAFGAGRDGLDTEVSNGL